MYSSLKNNRFILRKYKETSRNVHSVIRDSYAGAKMKEREN